MSAAHEEMKPAADLGQGGSACAAVPGVIDARRPGLIRTSAPGASTSTARTWSGA